MTSFYERNSMKGILRKEFYERNSTKGFLWKEFYERNSTKGILRKDYSSFPNYFYNKTLSYMTSSLIFRFLTWTKNEISMIFHHWILYLFEFAHCVLIYSNLHTVCLFFYFLLLLKVHLFEGTLIRGYTYSRVHLFEGTLIRGYTYSRVHLFEGTLIRGYTYSRVHLFEGTLIRGLHLFEGYTYSRECAN